MSIPVSYFVEVNAIVGTQPVEAFGFGANMLVAAHTETSNRQDGPYTSLDAMVAAGFTAAATPEIHAWGQAVFSQSGTFGHVDQVMIGRIEAGDANLTASLDAIYADDPTSWYITNILTRTDADIAELGAWLETKGPSSGYPKIGGWQSADLTWTEGTAQAALGYVRSGGIYHATSSGSADGYLDGAWWSVIGGYDQDAPGGPGNAKFVPLIAVTGDALTEVQANTIWDENGNTYGPSLGTPFTSNGTMAGGRKIKQTQSVDWVVVRLQEDYLNLLVSTKEVPFTPGGLGILEQVGLDRLQKGVTFGHFRGDEGFEPTISIPPIDTLDPQSGEVPITATVYFVNSVDKVTVTLYLQQG